MWARRKIRNYGRTSFNISTESGERHELALALKNKRLTLERIADRISVLYHIPGQEILSKGRRKIAVEARDIFCYIAVYHLKTTATEVARLVGMAPAAIGYAVTRGKKIAGEKGVQVIDELLK